MKRHFHSWCPFVNKIPMPASANPMGLDPICGSEGLSQSDDKVRVEFARTMLILQIR